MFQNTFQIFSSDNLRVDSSCTPFQNDKSIFDFFFYKRIIYSKFIIDFTAIVYYFITYYVNIKPRVGCRNGFRAKSHVMITRSISDNRRERGRRLRSKLLNAHTQAYTWALRSSSTGFRYFYSHRWTTAVVTTRDLDKVVLGHIITLASFSLIILLLLFFLYTSRP